MKVVLELLDRLDRARIHWSLRRTRGDALSIDAAVPGERWEIDVLASGEVEIEVFRSDGSIHWRAVLDERIERLSE